MSSTSQWWLKTIASGSMVNSAARFSDVRGGPGNAVQSTESNIQAPISAAGNLLTIRADLAAAPGAGKSWRFQISINGTPNGTLDFTIADAATSGSATGTVAVSAGDLITIKITPSGTPTAANTQIAVEFDPTTTGHYVYMGAGESGVSTAPQYARGLGTVANFVTTDNLANQTRDVVPFAGTLTEFYVKLTAAPGSGKSWDLIMVINGSEVAGTALNIADLATTGSLTGLSVAIAAGDQITFKVKAANSTPATTRIGRSITIVPTTTGLYAWSGVTLGNWSTTNRFVTQDGSGSAAINTTEANVQFNKAPAAVKLKALYIALSAAAGSGKSQTITQRVNTADSTLVAVATNATAGNDAHDVTLAQGDVLSLSQVETAAGNTSAGNAWAVAVTSSTVVVTTLTPSAATLTITGQTSHFTVTEKPAAQDLTLTGQTSDISQTRKAAAATLSLSGQLSPLTLTMTPAAATLTITGQTSSIAGYVLLVPDAATLTITGRMSALTGTLKPVAAALVLTGRTSHFSVTVKAGAASLSLAGQAGIATPALIPSAAALTLTGQTSSFTVTEPPYNADPGFRVDVFAAGGATKLGDGPVTKGLSARYERNLDQAGTGEIRFPANDAAASAIETGNELWIYRPDEGYVFRGTAERRTITDGVLTIPLLGIEGAIVRGNPMPPGTVFGANSIYGGSPAQVIAVVLSLSGVTGWDIGEVDDSLATFSADVSFWPPWKVWTEAGKVFGFHIRADQDNRRIDFGQFGDDSGVMLLQPDAMTDALRRNPRVGIIQKALYDEDALQIINYIGAQGNGTGWGAITMEAANKGNNLLSDGGFERPTREPNFSRDAFSPRQFIHSRGVPQVHPYVLGGEAQSLLFLEELGGPDSNLGMEGRLYGIGDPFEGDAPESLIRVRYTADPDLSGVPTDPDNAPFEGSWCVRAQYVESAMLATRWGMRFGEDELIWGESNGRTFRAHIAVYLAHNPSAPYFSDEVTVELRWGANGTVAATDTRTLTYNTWEEFDFEFECDFSGAKWPLFHVSQPGDATYAPQNSYLSCDTVEVVDTSFSEFEIEYTTDIHGRRFPFVRNQASIDTPGIGLRAKYWNVRNASPVEASWEAYVAACNAQFDIIAQRLRKAGGNLITFRPDVTSIRQPAFNLGQKMRVHYHSDEDNVTLDDDLWVMGYGREMGPDGSTWSFTFADTDLATQNAESVQDDNIRDITSLSNDLAVSNTQLVQGLPPTSPSSPDVTVSPYIDLQSDMSGVTSLAKVTLEVSNEGSAWCSLSVDVFTPEGIWGVFGVDSECGYLALDPGDRVSVDITQYFRRWPTPVPWYSNGDEDTRGPLVRLTPGVISGSPVIQPTLKISAYSLNFAPTDSDDPTCPDLTTDDPGVPPTPPPDVVTATSLPINLRAYTQVNLGWHGGPPNNTLDQFNNDVIRKFALDDPTTSSLVLLFAGYLTGHTPSFSGMTLVGEIDRVPYGQVQFGPTDDYQNVIWPSEPRSYRIGGDERDPMESVTYGLWYMWGEIPNDGSLTIEYENDDDDTQFPQGWFLSFTGILTSEDPLDQVAEIEPDPLPSGDADSTYWANSGGLSVTTQYDNELVVLLHDSNRGDAAGIDVGLSIQDGLGSNYGRRVIEIVTAGQQRDFNIIPNHNWWIEYFVVPKAGAVRMDWEPQGASRYNGVEWANGRNLGNGHILAATFRGGA